MRKHFTLLVFLAFIMSGTLHAQATMSESANALGPSSDFGSILSNLANGIKPDAFEKSWSTNKTKWMDKLKNVKMGDIPEYGKMAGDLVSNLKSTSFTNGFDIKGLTKSLTSSKDSGSLAGSLSNLTKGLNKSVYTDDFAKNLDTFNAGLDMMKK